MWVTLGVVGYPDHSFCNEGCVGEGAIVVARLNVSLLAHAAQPFHRDDLISGALNPDNAKVRVTESG